MLPLRDLQDDPQHEELQGLREEALLQRVSPPRAGAVGRAFRASLVAQMVKRLSAMQDTWVLSLGQEDPLEKEMAAHSSSLAWKIPWMEEPDRLQSMGLRRVGHN